MYLTFNYDNNCYQLILFRAHIRKSPKLMGVAFVSYIFDLFSGLSRLQDLSPMSKRGCNGELSLVFFKDFITLRS